jgi:zinc/manganese transport system substrate-binding protein
MTLRNALVGVLVAVSLTACGAGTSTTSDNGKIKVAASTNVWGSVVQAVGGDQVEVTSIIKDPSADPHSYESKPVDVAAVREAKLVIFNGGGYDDFFAKLIENDGQKKIETFVVAGNAPHAEGEGEEHDHEQNEHVWYDLDVVAKVAEDAATQLGEIAPDKKATFEANAKDFAAKVEELHKKIDGVGKGKKVVETEPVAHLLLETAGVDNVTPEAFSNAIEGETDVPAAALAEVNTLVEGKQINVLVNNAQTENNVTKQLVEKAKTATLPVVEVTETLPEGASGYLDWMTKQVDALAAALAK